MFPSLKESISPGGSWFSSGTAAHAFEHWVYLTFDEGDAFFVSPAREAEVRSRRAPCARCDV